MKRVIYEDQVLRALLGAGVASTQDVSEAMGRGGGQDVDLRHRLHQLKDSGLVRVARRPDNTSAGLRATVGWELTPDGQLMAGGGLEGA